MIRTEERRERARARHHSADAFRKAASSLIDTGADLHGLALLTEAATTVRNTDHLPPIIERAKKAHALLGLIIESFETAEQNHRDD